MILHNIGMFCKIDGCRKPILAGGLCRLHYFRRYRTGDPLTAPRKPGPKPRPKDEKAEEADEAAAPQPEVAELRQAVAARDAKIAALNRAYSGAFNAHSVLRRENEQLKRQLADARAANPGVTPSGEKAAGKLVREVDRLKVALARAEARLAADPGEVAKLMQQLKAARTRAANAVAEANANPVSLSRSEWRKLNIVIQPDSGAHASDKARTEAAQIFNRLKLHVRD
jgi:hypothetical protein